MQESSRVINSQTVGPQLGKSGKLVLWFSTLSTANCSCSAPFLPTDCAFSAVPGTRYDSVPVSRMWARSVIRSNEALQGRAFGITCLHSQNGELVVMITAAFSARPTITWNVFGLFTCVSGIRVGG
jgi:hypothetical protein